MNPAVNEILVQYDSLSAIIAQIPKNTKNYAELQKLWESFGETLHLFLLGYLDEIDTLKKELAKNKVEAEESIKQLNEKLKVFEASIPKADFAYSERVCIKEFGKKSWNGFEKETQTFLVTAYFLTRLLQASGSDFSAVIIEFAKTIENELSVKIFNPYLQYRKAPSPSLRANGGFGIFMQKYFEGKQKNVPLRLMFTTLEPSTRNSIVTYYDDLQDFIRKNNWNFNILGHPDFYQAGANYTLTYRNEAAHWAVIDELTALKCKSQTRTLLKDFISASPNT